MVLWMMRVMIAVLMIVMTTILYYVPEQEASHDTGRVSEVELEHGQYSLPIDSGSTPSLLLVTEFITKNVSHQYKNIYIKTTTIYLDASGVDVVHCLHKQNVPGNIRTDKCYIGHYMAPISPFDLRGRIRV